MRRTKIEWVVNLDGTKGYTWNPVTGCLHGCSYCYARKIAKRFFGKLEPYANIHEIQHVTLQGFKGGFWPTFHSNRLQEPFKIKKPSTIFVCSMSDLFGNWVPVEWIYAVLKTVEACPQHTFLFLSKNGARMARHDIIIDQDKVWYGQSCTGLSNNLFCEVQNRPGIPRSFRNFISFEPLIGDYIPNLTSMVKWVIIGALNKNGKPVPPEKGGTKKEWVLPLLDQADKHFIPVFVKDSLYELYPDLPQRRDLPYLKT